MSQWAYQQGVDARRAIAEPIARAFHDAYEHLAPVYGYKTREESAVPWDDVPQANRDLMIATVRRLLDDRVIHTSGRADALQEQLDELRGALRVLRKVA